MQSKPIETAAMTIAIEPLAVTVEQASKLINISDKSLRALARRPGFPKVCVGRKIMIPIPALRRWLEENIGQVLDVKEEC